MSLHSTSFRCSSLPNTAIFSSSRFATNSSSLWTARVEVSSLSAMGPALGCSPAAGFQWAVPLSRAACPAALCRHSLLSPPALLTPQHGATTVLPGCLPPTAQLKPPEQNKVPHCKCSSDIPHTYKKVISGSVVLREPAYVQGIQWRNPLPAKMPVEMLNLRSAPLIAVAQERHQTCTATLKHTTGKKKECNIPFCTGHMLLQELTQAV